MYALITGASSGLGKDLAILLAKEGYDLILVARRKELLDKLKQQLKNSKIIIKALDLSIMDNCKKLFDETKNLDIGLLINNAGFGNLGLFNNTLLDIELNMIDLNIKALQTLTKLYINNYSKGTIVNIGSLAGILPTPRHATYSATKSYINNFSRAINYELKRNNIDILVITVLPGPIKTGFNEVAKATINRGMDSKKCALKIVKGIKKQKSIIIPGFSNKFMYFLVKFIPTKILLKIAYNIQKSK